MLTAREKLRPLLKVPQSGRSWRDSLNYFHSGEGPQGSVNLSPTWFQQGHDMSDSVSRLCSLAAYSKSGNVARLPAGLCKPQVACCIGLARCHLRIQWIFERNPGGNP